MPANFRTLYAQDVVNPSFGESFDEFEVFYQTLFTAFNPTGPIQQALAEEVIANLWRIRRNKRRQLAHTLTNDVHVLLPLQRLVRRLSHSTRQSIAAFCRQAGIGGLEINFGPTSQPKSPCESRRLLPSSSSASTAPNHATAQRSDP